VSPIKGDTRLSADELADEVTRMMLDATWEEWVGGDGRSNVRDGDINLNHGGILHSGVSNALTQIADPGRSWDQHLSPVCCAQLLELLWPTARNEKTSSIPQQATTAFGFHADGSKGAGAVAARTVSTKQTAHGTPDALTSAGPVNSRKRGVTWMDSAKLRVIHDITAECIEKGLSHNTPGNHGESKTISLIVWHAGFSGTRQDLSALLVALRRKELLHPRVRVLLFAGTRSEYGAPGTRLSDAVQELEEAKSAVLVALNV